MTRSDTTWVEGKTFLQVLEKTVSLHPDRDALVFPRLGYRLSYAQFLEECRRVAGALLAVGVRRGEHVGIWATNCPQWVVTQFATAMIGAPLVNINPAYRSHELRHVLVHADIQTLVLTDRFKTSNYFEILQEVCPELSGSSAGEMQSVHCPRLRRVICTQDPGCRGIWNWGQFVEKAGEVTPERLQAAVDPIGPGEVVNIQYTSGTTGFPKGVQLTHRNLLMNAYFVGKQLRFTELDRLCIPVPFYHCFGCVMGTLMCAINGAAMVVPAEIFDPAATLQAVQDESCTGIYGVPSMFIAELDLPSFGGFDLSSLRTGIMAGSPCPIEVMRKVVDRMGVSEITIAYGLTEASPVITQTGTEDSLEQRVQTVGRVLPGVEARIVEPGGENPLPAGEPGELLARGHGIMKGYYKDLGATRQVISEDGWLRTGDLAIQTADGFFQITGRIKDLIIRGGENIYPREIEEFLYTHPDVTDVQVVGLPDEKYGEEIAAWIIPRIKSDLTEEAVRDFCKDRIAHFKIPRYVFLVSEYPTTVTGKIQKFKLRQMGVEQLRLGSAGSRPPVAGRS